MSEALDDIRTEQASEEDPAPKRRGRPKGSKNRPKGPLHSVPSSDTEQSPEEREAANAMLDQALGILVDIPIRLGNLSPDLSDPERSLMVSATKPVLLKYLPDMLLSVPVELVFVMVAWSIYGARWMEARERARQKDTGNGSIRNRKEYTIEMPCEGV